MCLILYIISKAYQSSREKEMKRQLCGFLSTDKRMNLIGQVILIKCN